MAEFFHLLWGTVAYRPYVYVFFLCFLFFAARHLGALGAAAYTIVAYLVAFGSEYSSTRNGFPFGFYTYLDQTRTRELWIANVPFWDSLSFVFLSYFSWRVAALLRRPHDPQTALGASATALLAGLLMMLLDVVIDPVALQGEHWFLGKIYFYPEGGSYFGVTLTNFVGWLFVGAVTIWLFQRLLCFALASKSVFGRWRAMGRVHAVTRADSFLCFVVYSGVFFFNWGVTLWIRRWDMACASGLVIILTLLPSLYVMVRRTRVSTVPNPKFK